MATAKKIQARLPTDRESTCPLVMCRYQAGWRVPQIVGSVARCSSVFLSGTLQVARRSTSGRGRQVVWGGSDRIADTSQGAQELVELSVVDPGHHHGRGLDDLGESPIEMSRDRFRIHRTPRSRGAYGGSGSSGGGSEGRVPDMRVSEPSVHMPSLDHILRGSWASRCSGRNRKVWPVGATTDARTRGPHPARRARRAGGPNPPPRGSAATPAQRRQGVHPTG
jgi:hypothetical protein